MGCIEDQKCREPIPRGHDTDLTATLRTVMI